MPMTNFDNFGQSNIKVVFLQIALRKLE